MNLIFLNCANRNNAKYIESFLENNNIDVAIFAEAQQIKKHKFTNYAFQYFTDYKYGLFILSKIRFQVNNIDYTINHPKLKECEDYQKGRLLNIKLDNGISIDSVHIDYGFYNQFAMCALENHIKNNKVDIIIGDFNSGYIEDNLDVDNGGIIFQNGLLYFTEYEKQNYINLKKGANEYSFINARSKRKFRIDHCFVKTSSATLTYVDDFLSNGISDHKAMLLNYPDFSDGYNK